MYFLVSEDGGTFKVGMTDDIARRAKTAAPSADRQRSWAVYFPSKALARDCETALKRRLANARYLGNKDYDGGSEWFRIEAFVEAGKWVRANKDQLGWVKRVSGEGIFTPYRVSLPIWVSEEVRRTLKLAAIEDRTTVNQIVGELIADWEKGYDARLGGDRQIAKRRDD